MQSRRFSQLCFIAVLLILIVGCATNTAPKGWLDVPKASQSKTFGGWLEVQHGENSTKRVQGELIALSPDRVFVLTDAGLLEIPKTTISQAKLTAYDSGAVALSVWTFLGTLSTISHGVFLIISAPVWVIGGSSITAVQSHKPVISYPENSWEAFQRYARFPQGLPQGLERSSLLPKLV